MRTRIALVSRVLRTVRESFTLATAATKRFDWVTAWLRHTCSGAPLAVSAIVRSYEWLAACVCVFGRVYPATDVGSFASVAQIRGISKRTDHTDPTLARRSVARAYRHLVPPVRRHRLIQRRRDGSSLSLGLTHLRRPSRFSPAVAIQHQSSHHDNRGCFTHHIYRSQPTLYVGAVSSDLTLHRRFIWARSSRRTTMSFNTPVKKVPIHLQVSRPFR